MKARTLVLLACALLVSHVQATDPIPSDRRITWQGNVGVPGGIPTNRTTIYVNVGTTSNSQFKCYGDGTTDNTTALIEALRNCPADQVVYMPAGTYLIASQVLINYSGVSGQNGQNTLRGAGMGQTIIKCNDGSLEFGVAQTDSFVSGQPITAGATKGSTVVTVGSTADVTVGGSVVIRSGVLQPYEHVFDAPSSNDLTSQICFPFKVVGKTGTTVTLSHPLPLDMSGMSPVLQPYSTTAPYRVWNGQGIEDLTFDMSTGNASQAVGIYQGFGCWLKNVEIKGSGHRQIYFFHVLASELRGCYFHDARGTMAAGREGADFGVLCSWNLVENNKFDGGGYPAVIFSDGFGHNGSMGNVVGYNFFNGNVAYILSFNHGPHTMFNLAEGNVIHGTYESDGYFGSDSYQTLFRNAFITTYCIVLKHMANYYNVVGNVLGYSGMTGTVYSPSTSGYSGGAIYELGYPNAGNSNFTGTQAATTPPDYSAVSNDLTDSTAQKRDLNVAATILRKGNYNYVDNSVPAGEALGGDTMPNSYYLSAQPSWWGAMPWPPIGSDLTPMVGTIPAQNIGVVAPILYLRKH